MTHLFHTIRGRPLDFWQALTYVLMVIYGTIILATFTGYGITLDEPIRVRYGAEIARWYGSFFQDRTIFTSKNTWLYGGAFDLVNHLVSTVLPLPRYDAAHLFNAFVGWLGVWGAYRIGCLLGGRRAGFLAALALVLTPRYYGHAFNNPKDIPFAVGYLWSVYFLLRGLEALPNLSRNLIFKIGLAIGLTLGVRIGGVLLLGYLGLFYAIRYIQLSKSEAPFHPSGRFLAQTAAIAAVSCGVMVLFWPWAQVHPLTGPWQAAGTFARFSEYHHSFFNGQYVLNTEIPRTYVLQWLALTLPEFVFAGLVLGMVCVKRTGANLPHMLLLFSGFFPVAYAVVSHMPFYDGIRHLIFAVPPLVVLAAIGIENALQQFVKARIFLIGAAVLLLGMVGFEMVRLHPNQSAYFNRVFAGGIEGAWANYETDYWLNSFKQGLLWIQAHPERHPAGRKLRLGSLYPDLLFLMADPDRFDCDVDPETADLFMGGTRYDHHRTIPGAVVHIVRAGPAPLLYIVRPDSSYRTDPFFAGSPAMHYRKGRAYEAANEMEAALKAYQRVIQCQSAGAPSAILPHHLLIRIGNVHLALGHHQDALTHYLKALKITPEKGSLYNNIGVVYARLGDYKSARMWIQNAMDVAPAYFSAHINDTVGKF